MYRTTLYFIIRSKTPGRFINFGWIFLPPIGFVFPKPSIQGITWGVSCLSCTSFPHHLLRKISFQLKKMVPYIIYTLYALSSRVRNCRPTFFKIGSNLYFCNILIRFVNQTNPTTLTHSGVGGFLRKCLVIEAKV